MGNWKTWLYSIGAAAIGGAATALGAALLNPASFNLTNSGLEHLGAVALFGAIVPVLALLKQSPLPPSVIASDTPPIHRPPTVPPPSTGN